MKPRNPIGFFWAEQQDPNCITLSSTASHRLGNMLGTFEDEKFSAQLESHLDQMNAKALKREQKISSLVMELETAKEQVELLQQQRLYLFLFLGLAAFFLMLLLVKGS